MIVKFCKTELQWILHSC